MTERGRIVRGDRDPSGTGRRRATSLPEARAFRTHETAVEIVIDAGRCGSCAKKPALTVDPASATSESPPQTRQEGQTLKDRPDLFWW